MDSGNEHSLISLALTEGDPAGVGPEVLVAALVKLDLFSERNEKVQGDYKLRIIIVGWPSHLQPQWPEDIPFPEFVPFSKLNELPEEPGVFGIIPQISALPVEIQVNDSLIDSLERLVEPGMPSVTTGLAAVLSAETAISCCLKGVTDGIVTAPLAKTYLHAAGYTDFPGHTELLAKRASVDHFAMMLVGGGLRVALATIHIPFQSVPASLSIESIVNLLRLMHRELPNFGIDRPRIGVAGLNPHAGEGGIFGDEEQRVIGPAIEIVKKEGILADGPHPGDTIFHRQLEGDFDAVLAMYHDQGLVAVKTLDFHGGVNTTLGLPFVRTSPDHGTAFSIAGTGQVNPSSMMSAIALAIEQIKHRRRRAGELMG